METKEIIRQEMARVLDRMNELSPEPECEEEEKAPPLQDATRVPAGIQIGRQGNMVVVDLGRPMELLALDLAGARRLLNGLRDVINGIEPVRKKAKRR